MTTDFGEPRWQPQAPRRAAALKRLPALVASVPREADLVILGDSLAAAWPLSVLEEAAPRRTRIFNFGLPGDRIQNTLWRLREIDTSHLRPQTAVIVLGTNNLGDGDQAAAIVDGLSTTAALVRMLWGDARIILVSIPRRHRPTPAFREADRIWINKSLRTLEGVDHLDADAVLSVPGSPVLEPDALHLSAHGYARLSKALAGMLQRADPLAVREPDGEERRLPGRDHGDPSLGR